MGMFLPAHDGRGPILFGKSRLISVDARPTMSNREFDNYILRDNKSAMCQMGAMIMLALSAALAVSGCTGNSPPPEPTAAGMEYKAGLPDTLDFTITVTGGMGSPLTLTYKDLKGMDFVQLKDVTSVNSACVKTTGTFAGVPMLAILKKAGLPRGNLTFVVTATDGYTKVYSMGQVRKAIIALKVNGSGMTTDIGDKAKCIRSVVPGENSEMWIKMPVKIDIQKS
jgi:DMSO/TMAO reductase YedYZ molybdopterin-dependent catalytic subunit